MTHSVVVPLYNKQAYVAETIASLAAQELPPDELIVVDDASTDDSLNVAGCALEQFAAACPGSRVHLIALPVNTGPGAARNAGLDRATGELISFLDADDGYRPDCLRLVGEGMQSHALDIAILGFREGNSSCFPDLDALTGQLTGLGDRVFLLSNPLRTVACPAFFMGRASNVVARRSWLQTQRFHATSRLNEGIDFWYRVLREVCTQTDARVALFAEPLIDFRVLSDSLSHRPPGDWRQLEMPPTIRRYANNPDRYDRQLMGMLGARWLEHAMSSLPSWRQKLAFVAYHLPMLARLAMYRRRARAEA